MAIYGYDTATINEINYHKFVRLFTFQIAIYYIDFINLALSLLKILLKFISLARKQKLLMTTV
jgi:hypothetical protein